MQPVFVEHLGDMSIGVLVEGALALRFGVGIRAADLSRFRGWSS